MKIDVESAVRDAVTRFAHELTDALQARGALDGSRDADATRADLAMTVQNLLGADFSESLERVIHGGERKVGDLTIRFLGAEEIAADMAAGTDVVSAIRQHIGFGFDCRLRRGASLKRRTAKPGGSNLVGW